MLKKLLQVICIRNLNVWRTSCASFLHCIEYSCILHKFIQEVAWSSVVEDICASLLPHVQWWPSFLNVGQKFRAPPTQKIWRPKSQHFGEILDNFATWSQISLDRNKISLITKNDIANCDHSCTCVPNLVNFGPQMVKNRSTVLTLPKSTFSDTHIYWAP